MLDVVHLLCVWRCGVLYLTPHVQLCCLCGSSVLIIPMMPCNTLITTIDEHIWLLLTPGIILAVTGDSTDGDFAPLLGNGVERIVVKPFNAENFRQIVYGECWNVEIWCVVLISFVFVKWGTFALVFGGELCDTFAAKVRCDCCVKFVKTKCNFFSLWWFFKIQT